MNKDTIDLGDFTNLFSKKIDGFINDEIEHWKSVDESIVPPLLALSNFISNGGKRLRPAFCYLGAKLMGSDDNSENLINAACCLELLHNFALVHDDFMDRSDLRRGAPTVHKFLESMYNDGNHTGDIEHFAASVAILAGDFAFTYADTFARDLPKKCLDVYDILKVELFAGQQMDIDAGYRSNVTKEQISKIAQYKSGKYTIERPIHLGALIADENAPLEKLSEFGSPLGEAFQLRDDILGTFGDKNTTGKPVGDDIREGKFTLLIASAIENANEKELEILSRRGAVDISEEEIIAISKVIQSNGALDDVEKRIQLLYNDSMEALEKINPNDDAKKLAISLAHYVCWRDS